MNADLLLIMKCFYTKVLLLLLKAALLLLLFFFYQSGAGLMRVNQNNEVAGHKEVLQSLVIIAFVTATPFMLHVVI